MELSYTAELRRKAIHLPALLLPLAILVLDPTLAGWTLGVLAVGLIAGDLARWRIPAVQRLVVSVFGSLMRAKEIEQPEGPLPLNGATWVCVGAALCAILFPPAIAAAALAITMLGDAAAAIVGRKMGRVRIPRSQKTLEGSLAFCVAGTLGAVLVTLWPDVSLTALQIGVGVLVGVAAEALPLRINDNVRVPLLVGLGMVLIA